MDLPPESHLVAFYPVRDLAATQDFYARDLGLALARDQGSCLIFRAPGGGHFGFCHNDAAEIPPSHDGLILTLVTPDVDGLYQHLRRVGVETEARPSRNEAFGIYHFFARDPDGYRVEVQRFDRPLLAS
jgi:catechol 2,3-dioxygenase-like lactoylglutathione lyase family enzyme